MKKVLAALAVAAMSTLGWGMAATAAHAASATECHSVQITVNGADVVNQAACNTLPPQ
jgi:hypothetical protein